MPTFFEALFLIFCGLSWPVSVYRSYVSRKTAGKSLVFLCLLEVGYIFGLIGKIFFNPSYVIAVYIINGSFIAVDISLYLRNRKLERAEAGL